MPESDQDAFVLRIKPMGEDRVPEALEDNDLIIGWSQAEGLLDESLSRREFREIIHQTYHADEDSYRRSGSDAGNMWRFIREMDTDDLVVVPHGNKFYVGRVDGPARYEPDKVPADTAYRRDVEWLNDATPVPRGIAKAALQSRMKVRQTCARATSLVEDIEDAVTVASDDRHPTFGEDLRQRLVAEALSEIRSGRIDSYGFENLVASILVSLGGEDVEVVSRSQDEGADILATFNIAETFQLTLAVQAKHYFNPEPPVPVDDVDQLARGMEHEDATHGWLATAGAFSDAAERRKDELEEERGFQIQLIDGEQLAALVVEGGLREAIQDL